jgi:hypothetical protein
VQVRPVTGFPVKRHRRERDLQAVARGGPADHDPREDDGVGRGDGCGWGQGHFDLIVAVFGMELFDAQACALGGDREVDQERGALQRGAHAIGRPGLRRRVVAVKPQHRALEFGADERREATIGNGLFGACEQRAHAQRRRIALLVVQVAWGPGHAVLDLTQIRGIDPDPQIADDPDGGCEGDTAVDAEDTPRRRHAHAGAVKRGESAQRHVLGPSDPCQIRHRAGDEFDAVPAQFADAAGEFGVLVDIPAVAQHRHRTSSGILSLRADMS